MRRLSLALSAALISACGGAQKPAVQAATAPTAEEARSFLAQADTTLRELTKSVSEVAWNYMTNINPDTERALSEASAHEMVVERGLTESASRLRAVSGLTASEARQIELFRRGSTVPGPSDPEARAELATILTQLDGMYGAGKSCDAAGEHCRDLGDLENVLTEQAAAPDAANAWDAQLDAWLAWRTISPPMRPKYQRFVEIGNGAAKELGYSDMSEMWRSGYDMDPDAFNAEVERLWQQVKPLYEKLHCYTRAKLSERYGADKVPLDKPIPAHILGNMWSQSWENLFPILAPYPDAEPIDLTAALQASGMTPLDVVRSGESFFKGLGLPSLPESFWTNSMLLKPADRDVVCHASAWDVDMQGDVRIKMCTHVTSEDFITVHHELGHVYYYLAYNALPAVFQQGANDGFHEGIGDTLTLSITPAYLKRIGLDVPATDDMHAVLNHQMSDALAKIAFLPFGRMIDLWRWGVFSGEITPDHYNEAWWKLREAYQGIEAPVERSEADFDPGAKYHIPGNTPYMRYFLAHILQFQFHEALCKAAGHEGPLYTCSIAGSEEAGKKLWSMLSLGASVPWPVALEAITGSPEMDAGPLLHYFEPLEHWLDEQNQGQTCGW